MNCPKCKIELEIDDVYDCECDVDFFVRKVVGYCPKCGKECQWELVYKFYGEENLVECI